MFMVLPFVVEIGFTSEILGGNKKAAGFSQRPLGDLRREICLRREPQEALSGALRKALIGGRKGRHGVAPHGRIAYARVGTCDTRYEEAIHGQHGLFRKSPIRSDCKRFIRRRYFPYLDRV